MTKPAQDQAAKARARLRRASWIAGGMGFIALAAAVWIALTASPKLESPPLPQPNGFDDALRAGQAIVQTKFLDAPKLDVSTADAETLRPWVETNRQAVATLREAAKQPFQVPVTYDLNAITEQVNQYAPIRRAASALHAEGRLAALEGRNAEAAEAFLDLHRLGNVMGRQVPMLHFMASMAPIHLGLIGLREIRESLTAEELARVIAELEALDAASVTATEPTRLEHAFMERNVSASMGLGGILYRAQGALARDQARVASSIAFSERSRSTARRLLLVDLALRLHRLKTGAEPDRLEALVPSILKAVPIDPHSGKPLTHRATADGHLIWSTGPDSDDDQGNPPLKRGHLPTANGDFTLDSF
jgi:hypothetical protein